MEEEAIDRVELTIPAKSEYVGVARLTTSGIANRMGYAYDDIEDIKIAISEACTNAVNHAYSDNQNGTITLILDVFESKLDVVVMDAGKSFDYENVVENLEPIAKGQSIEQMREGGLGLFLIETLMDNVTISGHSGVNVKMTKFLHKGEVLRDASKVSTKTD